MSDIDQAFTLVMPTQDQYEAYDKAADIKKFKDIGDASRIAMILQADASIRQKASWFSLTDLAGDKTRDQMNDVEGENYDELMRNLTHANTALLTDASETLEFNSIDSLDQVSLKHETIKMCLYSRVQVPSIPSPVNW